jgi:hypothetical protein
MKNFFVLSAIITLLAGACLSPVRAQAPTKDDTPTFYRLTPGVYVNPWPRFSVNYPKEWVQTVAMPQEIFRAIPPGNTGDVFSVEVIPYPQALDKVADAVTGFFIQGFGLRDCTVVRDNPSRLSNGTATRDVEIRGTMNGLPFNFACLCVDHGGVWIMVMVSSQSGKIGEHLTAILQTLQYEPTRDKQVLLPPDVQAFLDSFRAAWISHDLAKFTSHYSDKYLNSGVRKGEIERFYKPILDAVASCETTIVEFVAAGDRAHLAGWSTLNGERRPVTTPTIIKENGEWKWYGNQKDVAR